MALGGRAKGGGGSRLNPGYSLRLIDSNSAPSMRVCQPGPVALKCSITSGDSRSETSFLVGAFCGPRLPRRTTLP